MTIYAPTQILKSSEYSTPVLGLIFLKFADNNYRRHEDKILAEYKKLKGTRNEKKLSKIAIEKCGFYLPDHARYQHLLELPEKEDIAKALKEAMKAIEEYKPELAGVLPKDEYFRLTRDEKTKTIPNSLLKNFANFPADTSGDLFDQMPIRLLRACPLSRPKTWHWRLAVFCSGGCMTWPSGARTLLLKVPWRLGSTQNGSSNSNARVMNLTFSLFGSNPRSWQFDALRSA